ncbi:hypothetical protein CXK98_19560 [Stutzerimonas kunmingensis]|nr:hypothetical protein CXK98_19560 [Stutzerimonas kunmingensis]
MGFMFGGPFVSTRLELSRQYFDAANLLLDAIKKQRIEDYALTNPALFLFRHALELVLKAILERRPGGAPAGHDLAVLLEYLQGFAKDRFNQDVPEWIVRRIEELAAIDPGSTAFRYGKDRYDGKGSKPSSIAEEVYVGLPHLQAVMDEIYTTLAHAAGRMDNR